MILRLFIFALFICLSATVCVAQITRELVSHWTRKTAPTSYVLYDMNDAGTVVGVGFQYGLYFPAVWRSGQGFQLLNYPFQVATAINNRDQILLDEILVSDGNAYGFFPCTPDLPQDANAGGGCSFGGHFRLNDQGIVQIGNLAVGRGQTRVRFADPIEDVHTSIFLPENYDLWPYYCLNNENRLFTNDPSMETGQELAIGAKTLSVKKIDAIDYLAACGNSDTYVAAVGMDVGRPYYVLHSTAGQFALAPVHPKRKQWNFILDFVTADGWTILRTGKEFSSDVNFKPKEAWLLIPGRKSIRFDTLLGKKYNSWKITVLKLTDSHKLLVQARKGVTKSGRYSTEDVLLITVQ